jgi:hypothetical protein
MNNSKSIINLLLYRKRNLLFVSTFNYKSTVFELSYYKKTYAG